MGKYSSYENFSSYATKWGWDLNQQHTKGKNPRYVWYSAVNFFQQIASKKDPGIKPDNSGLWSKGYLSTSSADELYDEDAKDIYEPFIELERKRMAATLELNFSMPKVWLTLKSRPTDKVRVWSYAAGTFKDV